MSRTIDEKVVSLQFDNDNFEKNVSTSMSTLEKLKHALRLDGATEGFEEIENASNKINLTNLIVQNENVQKSFSILEEVAVGVYRHIGEQAAQLAEKTLYGLSGIENFNSGYQKYVDKTSSVQTLINSTGKDLNEINGYLDTLMRFSDETSYGFTEMAKSLAQLTSSGGDIEKLVPMITGIANATAFAGKGPAEFSRAIYNLNQSYGAGYLKLMDWKSLELAGVASKDLKQSFIDTAIALGTLSKNAATAKGHIVDIGTFNETLKDNWADKKVMEETFAKFSQFTQMADEMVNRGEYSTYSKAYEALSQLEENYGNIYLQAAKAAQEAKTFNEAIEATKDAVASSWLETFEIIFGDYEQAKRTWTNLANDLYDIFAVPRQDFNDMLGRAFKSQYDQIKDIFDETGEDFDKVDSEFKKFLKDNGYDVDKFIKQYGSMSYAIAQGDAVIKDALGNTETNINELFQQFWGDDGTGINWNNEGYFQKLVEDQISKIENVWDGTIKSLTDPLTQIQEIYDKIWAGDFGNGADRIKALADASIDYATAQELINKMAKEGHRAGYKLTADDIKYLTEEQLKNIGVTDDATGSISEFAFALYFAEREVDKFSDAEFEAWGITRERAKELSRIGINYENLMKRLNGRSGQVLLSETIHNMTQSIINLQEAAKDTWKKLFGWDFSEIILRGLLRINEFSEGVKNFTENLKNGLETNSLWNGGLKILSGTLELVASIFRLLWEVGTQLISGVLVVLSGLFDDLNVDIGDLSMSASDAIDKITEWLDENNGVFELVQSASESVKEAFKNVREWLEEFIDFEQVSKSLEEIKKNIEGIAKGEIKFSWKDLFNVQELDTLGSIFKDTKENVNSGLKEPIKSASDVISDVVTRTVGNIDTLKKTIDESITKTFEKLKLSEDQMKRLGEIWRTFKHQVTGLGIGYLTLTMFGKVADVFNTLVKPMIAFSEVMGSVKGSFNALTSYLNALKTNIQVNNIMKIGIAVGIVAAAMYALAMIGKENPGALWTAVGATLLLIAGMVMMAYALKVLSEANTVDPEKKRNVSETLKSIAILIVAIGITAALLAGSLKSIDKLKHALIDAAALVIIMAGLLLAIIGFAALAKRFEITSINFKDIASALMGMVLFGVAVKIFVSALKDMDQLQVENPWKILSVLIGLIAGFAVVAFALRGVSGKSAFVLLAFATSVWSMVEVIKRLSKEMTDEDFEKGLSRLIPIMALMALVIVASKAVSKAGAGWSAVLIVSIAGSVLLMGHAIEKLAELTDDQIRRGGAVAAALYAVIAIFGGIASLLAGIGKATLKGAIGTAVIMVVAAGSLYIMAGVMEMFRDFSKEELIKAGGTIAGLLLAVGLMLKMIGQGGLFNQENAAYAVGTITRIAVLIAVIAASIAGLAFMAKFNPEPFKAAVEGLAQVILSLAILFAALQFTSQFTKGSAIASMGSNLLNIVGALAAVTGSLYVLSTFTEADKVLAAAEALSKIFVSLAEAFAMMAAASGIIAITGAEIAAVIPVFGTFGLVVTAVASVISLMEALGLTNTDQIERVFNTITLVFTKVGEAIGGFAGGILSEFTEQFYDDIAMFGKSLSEFSDSIQGFLNLKIPAGFSTTLTTIGSIFTTFQNYKSVIQDLSSLSGDEESLTNLTSFLSSFGTSLGTMSANMGDASVAKLNVAVKAGQMLADLNTSMQSVDALGYGGTETLSSFSSGLEDFGDGLAKFSQKLWQFDGTAVSKNMEAIKDIIALEGTTTEQGLLHWIMGQQSLGDFGDRAKNFGAGLKEFSTSLQGFDPATVDTAKAAAETLTELEKGLVRSPTLFGYIGVDDEGNKSLQDFGTRVREFALNLKLGFSAFAELSGVTLPDEEAIQRISSFGQLPTVAAQEDGTPKESLLDIMEQNVDRIIAIADAFGKLEGTLAESGSFLGTSSSLSNLGAGIAIFSGGFQDFALALSQIEVMPTAEQATQVADVVKALMSIASVEGADTAGGILNSIGTGLQSMAQGLSGLFEGFTSSFSMGSLFTTGTDETGLQQDGGFLSLIQGQILGMFSNEELLEAIRQAGLNIARTYLMAIAQELLGQEYENARNIAGADAMNIADQFRYYEGGDQSYQSIYEEIAVNYLQGLLDGITNEEKIGEILSQITTLGTLMVETMRNALAVASPSKLTYGIGLFFVQGLINGIDDLTESAAKSAEALADSVSGAVRSAMAASDDVISDEYSPVITPVLDTSNISRGSSAINSMLNSSKTYNAALAVQAARSASANNQNGSAGMINNINVSFNVDKAGGELSDADISRYGRQIADEVNVRLGLKLKGGR